MSRSRRKTPIISVSRTSNGAIKKWKKAYNRAMRRHSGEEHPRKDEYSDEWTGPRDGKVYVGKDDVKSLRK